MRGSRASRPGSRAVRIAALAVAAAAIAAAVGVYLARPGPSQPATDRYGGLPSWLPQAKVPVGRIASASAAHPWLAIEGDTVSVHLADARVLVTAVGPVVPEEGRFPVPQTTPCAFTVTFAAASRRLPLDPKAFTILDELGHVHSPVVTAAGGGAPPRSVPPVRTVTLKVRDVLPTGSGTLRWAPRRTAPIVSWDFDVEID